MGSSERRSTTRHGPKYLSSATSAIAAAPRVKWLGASACVPMCSVVVIVPTSHEAPSSIDATRRSAKRVSPGKTPLAAETRCEMSISDIDHRATATRRAFVFVVRSRHRPLDVRVLLPRLAREDLLRGGG